MNPNTTPQAIARMVDDQPQEFRVSTAAYRGVYVSKNDEFYRVETKPGLTMSIPNKDIVTVRLIREENVVQDNVSTNQTGAAGF